MTSPWLPLHLGGLHPYEQALAMLLAFGPFVVLGVVIAIRRHQDAVDEVDADRELTPSP